jgi:predicted lipoprotein with Yx(FWY)xxD motif
MKPRLSRTAITLGGVALASSLAIGCGGGGSSSTTNAASGSSEQGATASTAASTSGAAATVDVADNSKLGQILVDAQGRTLYLFEKDESDESYCSGKCAKVWPPYTTKGGLKAGTGVDGAKLGTVKRDDGTTQVTYNGSPLYLYVSDKKAGDAGGNELDQFGAEWYALRPSGDKAEGDESGGGSSGGDESGGGSSGGSGGSGSSGGGYSY